MKRSRILNLLAVAGVFAAGSGARAAQTDLEPLQIDLAVEAQHDGHPELPARTLLPMAERGSELGRHMLRIADRLAQR